MMSQFHACDLSHTKFTWARVHVAIFRDCDFKQTDWSLANWGYLSAFYDCDFTGANGHWHKDDNNRQLTMTNIMRGAFDFNNIDFENKFYWRDLDLRGYHGHWTRDYPNSINHIAREFNPASPTVAKVDCKHLLTKSRDLFRIDESDPR